ncbi:MAG: hypothetical protein D6769_03850 [Methanobacteriota archaeon]|nr:MAG: hypothetical protein D6769_03850 [Euryarchaeota archaeon]
MGTTTTDVRKKLIVEKAKQSLVPKLKSLKDSLVKAKEQGASSERLREVGYTQMLSQIGTFTRELELSGIRSDNKKFLREVVARVLVGVGLIPDASRIGVIEEFLQKKYGREFIRLSDSKTATAIEKAIKLGKIKERTIDAAFRTIKIKHGYVNFEEYEISDEEIEGVKRHIGEFVRAWENEGGPKVGEPEAFLGELVVNGIMKQLGLNQTDATKLYKKIKGETTFIGKEQESSLSLKSDIEYDMTMLQLERNADGALSAAANEKLKFYKTLYNMGASLSYINGTVVSDPSRSAFKRFQELLPHEKRAHESKLDEEKVERFKNITIEVMKKELVNNGITRLMGEFFGIPTVNYADYYTIFTEMGTEGVTIGEIGKCYEDICALINIAEISSQVREGLKERIEDGENEDMLFKNLLMVLFEEIEIRRKLLETSLFYFCSLDRTGIATFGSLEWIAHENGETLAKLLIEMKDYPQTNNGKKLKVMTYKRLQALKKTVLGEVEIGRFAEQLIQRIETMISDKDSLYIQIG